MKHQSVQSFLAQVAQRNAGQSEYLQAVTEVMDSLWPFIQQHPRYAQQSLLERLVEPERIIIFRVSWVDDRGEVQVNRGYRIQHSLAIGPYKGGLRFHPSVNLSVLKFLAFEQTLKNALTTLPMGGGKGGSDFDPKDKSEGEVMRFCQAFVLELFRHIGADTDVPAGDIGVGGREVGFMAGMVKKLTNRADSVFTGKGLSGAKVVTVSDSGGTVVDERGFTASKLATLMEVKNLRHGRVADYAKRVGANFHPGLRPWHVPVDVALPCATQNELDAGDAAALVMNGVGCVVEGANMPCTLEAVHAFEAAGVLYAPGKASNAGGVATSGLEMSQNAARLAWPRQEVDARLLQIMRGIHEACVQHGRRADGTVSYVDGANIAGFVKVADAMLAQGVT